MEYLDSRIIDQTDDEFEAMLFSVGIMDEAADVAGLTNDSVEEQIRDKDHVYFAYVYYFGAYNNREFCDHYIVSFKDVSSPYGYRKIEQAEIPRLIETSLSDLRNQIEPENFTKIGDSLQGISWNRRSHLIFIWDYEQWQFLLRGEDSAYLDKTGIVFEEAKGKTPNFSFYNGQRHDGNLDGADFTSYYAINYLMNAKPSDTYVGDCRPSLVRGERFDYKFSLYLRFKYTSTSPGQTRIFDPGGSNGGPAQPPPDRP